MSRRTPPIIILIVCVGALAGCVDDPQGAKGPTSDASVPPSAPGQLEISFEDCWKSIATTRNDVSWVQPLVPEGFRAIEFTPGFANVQLILLECSRVVLPATVVQDVRMVQAGVIAFKEFGDDPKQVGLYLAAYTSDEVLSSALVDTGVTAFSVGIKEEITVAAAGAEVRSWQVDASNHSFGLDFATSHVPNGVLERRSQGTGEVWFAGPPHVEGLLSVSEIPGSTAPIIVTTSGESLMTSLYGGNDKWPGEQQERWNVDQQLLLTGGMFP